MKISTLLEASADDLFRKIDALDAMINDASTTEGEKSNAKSLKQKIAAKLTSEFPGAARSAKTQSRDHYSPFWDEMTKSYAAAENRRQRYDADPEAERQDALVEIERLKRLRKNLRPQAAMGDVEAAEELRHVIVN